MVKLLIAILIFMLLMAYGIYHYTSGNSSIKTGSGSTQSTGASGAINGAKNAVDQTQDLQNRINNEANQQLNQ